MQVNYSSYDSSSLIQSSGESIAFLKETAVHMIKKIRQESTIPEKPFPKNKDKNKNDPLWLPDGEEDKYHLDDDAAEWTSPDEDYDTGDLERIVGHRTRVVEGKIQHQL